MKVKDLIEDLKGFKKNAEIKLVVEGNSARLTTIKDIRTICFFEMVDI